MKAALFLVLFILFSSFIHDIHYSFHSFEREMLELKLFHPQKLSLLRLKLISNLNSGKFSSIFVEY